MDRRDIPSGYRIRWFGCFSPSMGVRVPLSWNTAGMTTNWISRLGEGSGMSPER
jgi:hypothetical protein